MSNRFNRLPKRNFASISWLERLLLLSPAVTLINLLTTLVMLGYGVHVHQATTALASVSAASDSAIATGYLPGLESNTRQQKHSEAEAQPPSVQLSEADFYRLVTLSILEAPTRMGRLDVIQSIFNRLHAPSAGLNSFGSTITEIVFAEQQYEPYFDLQASDIFDQSSALQVLQANSHDRKEALTALSQVAADLQNTDRMADARAHVGGRTDFKGVSQYPNRMADEDPRRQVGENFFHVDPHSQTSQQLSRLAVQGPLVVQISE